MVHGEENYTAGSFIPLYYKYYTIYNSGVRRQWAATWFHEALPAAISPEFLFKKYNNNKYIVYNLKLSSSSFYSAAAAAAVDGIYMCIDIIGAAVDDKRYNTRRVAQQKRIKSARHLLLSPAIFISLARFCCRRLHLRFGQDNNCALFLNT